MYFAPIILTSFQPYFCNFIPQPVQIVQEVQKVQIQENINSLSCAVEKFEQLILPNDNSFRIELTTDYMNLSPKNSVIHLPAKEEFISFYNEVINRYKFTYRNSKVKHSWSQQDVVILLWLTNWHYSRKRVHPIDFERKDWLLIASMVPFRSSEDCMYKWLSLRNNQLQDCPWTQSQKEQLTALVQSNENIDWVDISKKLFSRFSQKYRTPKQCKQSWSIILSCRYQRSKKFWSPQEDSSLIEAFSKNGRKWKHIASIIPGRSQNAIKNRFTLLSQKYLNKKITNKSDKDLIVLIQAKMLEETAPGSNQS